MNIEQLTPEQKASLKAQLEAEERAEKDRKRMERNTYEDLRNAQVLSTFKQLQKISSELELAKQRVFDEFSALLKMKQELFELTEEQMLSQGSHTFTSTDGEVSVVIGHNVIDRWDETVSVGVERVNEWLKGLARDENSSMLVGMIRDLMKPNKEGVLKANRILDLSKKAAEIGDKDLIEAVDLIRDAYRPAKTSTYVKAKFKDDNGQTRWLPLGMSAV